MSKKTTDKKFVSKKSNTQKKSKHGFVALTAVILLSAVLLFVVTSLSLQIIDELQISSAFEQSRQAKLLAFACAENVLLEIANDAEYAGSGTISEFDELDGECGYSVVGDYPDKTIEIESTVGSDNYVAKIEIVVSTTDPVVTVASWNDSAEF